MDVRVGVRVGVGEKNGDGVAEGAAVCVAPTMAAISSGEAVGRAAGPQPVMAARSTIASRRKYVAWMLQFSYEVASILCCSVRT